MQTSYIAVISAKGGVGKTTTAINLGAALMIFGRHVTVVDGNYTKPNVGLQLGLTKLDATLHHTLKGTHMPNDALVVHPSGLNVIPGSILYEELHEKHTRKLQDVLTFLRAKTEAVILDSGPGFSQELFDVLDAVDKAIIVTTPELSAVTDGLRTKKVCKDKGIELLGVVVTHVKEEPHIQIGDIETIFELPVIAEIPYDEHIGLSQKQKYPCVYAYEHAPASMAYKKLAGNLIGEEYNEVPREKLFDYVLKRLGFR